MIPKIIIAAKILKKVSQLDLWQFSHSVFEGWSADSI